MDPEEVNYIVFADKGLVTYRFVMDGDEVHEFDDLEQAIRFAQENDVAHVGVVFPDGDVHLIPILARGFVPGHQNTSEGETP
jgi:hypothetical protein